MMAFVSGCFESAVFLLLKNISITPRLSGPHTFELRTYESFVPKPLMQIAEVQMALEALSISLDARRIL
ncbi:hypothetical protein, partial [Leisingera sp. S232]|uniref:hypothetical protein n=1 Tax=Leisingera sp. S232 TaxID=3415132 RepID=UPI003C7E393F